MEDQMQTALARLRAKTDQDVSTLVARQLKRSLADAKRGHYQDVTRTYRFARTVIAVAGLPPAHREPLERYLAALRPHIELPASAVA
jgi:hypothetical protein